MNDSFLNDIRHVGGHLMDGVSVTTIYAAFIGALPEIATILGIIWWLIRIWETETVRGLTGRDRRGRRKND